MEVLGEEELEARLYPLAAGSEARPQPPSPATIPLELRREGVTLRLFHEQYFLGNPNGYGYTKFDQGARRVTGSSASR